MPTSTSRTATLCASNLLAELPLGRGKKVRRQHERKLLVDMVVGVWQANGTLTLSLRLCIPIPNDSRTELQRCGVYGAPRSGCWTGTRTRLRQEEGDSDHSGSEHHCRNAPDARLAYGNLGNYSNFMAPGLPALDFSLFKDFPNY